MAAPMQFSILVAIISSLTYYLLAVPSGRVLVGPVGGLVVNTLGLEIVRNITVKITRDTLKTDFVTASFVAYNPLPVNISITNVYAKITVDGIHHAELVHTFNNWFIPSQSHSDSGKLPPVKLLEGAVKALQLLNRDLDIVACDIGIELTDFIGLQLRGVKQTGIKTKFDLKLTESSQD